MPIARSTPLSAASGRGGTRAPSTAAPLLGALDEEAEMILFTAGNRGELPGECSRRPGPYTAADEPESPYWATWGF